MTFGWAASTDLGMNLESRNKIAAITLLSGLLAVASLAGCDDRGGFAGGSDDDVAAACESVCENVADCPVVGGDGCQAACEDASDDCRSCLADTETCGDECADACADDLQGGSQTPDEDESIAPASCDPGNCAVYCESGGGCEYGVPDCIEHCEAACGDGTFERADNELIECVLASPDASSCSALDVCCGSGDDKSASDFCF